VSRSLLYRLFSIPLIILVGLLAYSNSINVPFQFDDFANIVKNPFIRYLAHHPDDYSISEMLLINVALKKRIVGFLSFAMNYKLHGFDVSGYHIFNILVHITNGLLIYWLVSLTFKTPYFRQKIKNTELYTILIPLFSSLFFVSHPVQTQAVTYIVQRFASLATMFYLSSIVMYIKARLGHGGLKIFYYSISIISAILAMYTKEIAFTLPIILILYEFIFLEGRSRIRVFYLLPLILTMLIIPLNLIGINKPIGELISDVSEVTRGQTSLSRMDYLFTEFRVIMTYIRLLLLPVNQNLDYDYPIYHSFFNPQVFISFILLSLLFIAGVYMLFRSRSSEPSFRLIGFGIFWFFITLSVESSIIPIRDVIFEHRLYLPSIGFIVMITTSVFLIIRHIKRQWIERAVILLCILIVFVLCGATYTRNMVWADEVTLWSDVISKSPKKARGYINLGHAYKNKGEFHRAIEYYKIALELNPDDPVAHNNLADVYISIGLYDSAIEHGQIAISSRPEYVEAYNTTGLAYFYKGLNDRAILYFSNAISLNPFYAEAYSNLGSAYARAGFIEEAIKSYRTALRLDPGLAGANYNLGIIYLQNGEIMRQ
jgi:tetratricopeptide (TPR) repeat protein